MRTVDLTAIFVVAWVLAMAAVLVAGTGFVGSVLIGAAVSALALALGMRVLGERSPAPRDRRPG